jgi:thiol-disulfide isomerase/thioredoxin
MPSFDVSEIQMKIEYYTAEWCKPCQWYKPVVERLAAEFEFELEYIDVSDKVPEGILSIPTLDIHDERFGTRRYSGAYPEAKLRKILMGVE